MRLFAIIAAVSAVTGIAAADLTNPLVPEWRGDAGTLYAGWDSFTSADGGANAPEAGSGFDVYNFGPGAVIASSGNIYAAGGPLDIHIYSNVEIAASEAVLSFSFLGSPIDTSDVRAFFLGQYIDPIESELRALEDFGGFVKETWSFTYDFSNVGGVSSTVAFFFGSGDLTNSSLDAVSVDVLSVPAPGAIALLGIAGLTSRRRRG
ncbi:MAG: hypothetical protein GY728_01300 [Phycisphaeraceae bacterium]|nr:hypothetical protein [Phycisphaeraceae bacterium]MCP4011721.1 hypothetical protein [Phycisphaeraceae bacterium]MCP4069001.1 hypothetical protein [Phycisphaeraceae bacterium]MCP4496193.1 hypothetical protein [Phycisphaeraceae bacterium]MCP4794731.1 hypothetical protein [Phycisphaeraceae bacterium]